MKLQHQDVLAVIFVDDLALLDGRAETTGNVGVTGVGSVAVDVHFHAPFADQHVPVAAGRTRPDGKVTLALAQDLIRRSIRLPVGGEAAEANGVAVLHVLLNGFR